MKIAYVTSYDSSDPHAWSGLGSNILRTLQGSGFQTETVGKLHEQTSWVVRGKDRLYQTFRRRYLPERDPIILKSYATQVGRALTRFEHDIVFSPGTIPIAYLQIEKPIVF